MVRSSAEPASRKETWHGLLARRQIRLRSVTADCRSRRSKARMARPSPRPRWEARKRPRQLNDQKTIGFRESTCSFTGPPLPYDLSCAAIVIRPPNSRSPYPAPANRAETQAETGVPCAETLGEVSQRDGRSAHRSPICQTRPIALVDRWVAFSAPWRSRPALRPSAKPSLLYQKLRGGRRRR